MSVIGVNLDLEVSLADMEQAMETADRNGRELYAEILDSEYWAREEGPIEIEVTQEDESWIRIYAIYEAVFALDPADQWLTSEHDLSEVPWLTPLGRILVARILAINSVRAVLVRPHELYVDRERRTTWTAGKVHEQVIEAFTDSVPYLIPDSMHVRYTFDPRYDHADDEPDDGLLVPV